MRLKLTYIKTYVEGNFSSIPELIPAYDGGYFLRPKYQYATKKEAVIKKRKPISKKGSCFPKKEGVQHVMIRDERIKGLQFTRF